MLVVAMGYNERKLQILEFIYENGDVTSFELAEALDLEIHNARTLLKRYHEYGLLSRIKVDSFGTRVYMITNRGIERLEWLRSD